MTKIKICGLMSKADAELVNALNIDYTGVVMFFPKSHRNMEPAAAKAIVSAVKNSIRTVAVVVAPTVEQIREIERCGFDMIQIHGELREEVLEACSLPILKAFNVSDMDMLERFNETDKIIGYVFDAAEPGSGKTFDWSMLQSLPRGGKLTILAGGLTAQNVGKAIEFLHPDGVDVSSGVENESGTGKSPIKAAQFVAAVRG